MRWSDLARRVRLATASRRHLNEPAVNDGLGRTITAELKHEVVFSGDAELSKRSALGSLLEDVPLVSFEADATRAYGPARFATRERKRGTLDKLVAAHATALNIVLVTNNEADFLSYPGLSVENWVNRH